jgi:hypothetical protein
MMSRKRQDVHSPTNLITEDYEYAGCSYFGSSEQPKIIAPLNADGWYFGEGDHAGDCYHCGAHLKYFAILKHAPSHSLVRVGETCLDNRFSLATADFQRLRKEAKLDRQRERAREEGEVWKAAFEREVEFLREYYATRQNGGKFNSFFSSLCDALTNYGHLTERQLEALRKQMGRWQGQPELSIPVPEGEGIQIFGKVLSAKMRTDNYGTRLTLTIKDDRGFRVWGRAPWAIAQVIDPDYLDAAKGMQVGFTATVRASDDDPSFGFYTYPTEVVL